MNHRRRIAIFICLCVVLFGIMPKGMVSVTPNTVNYGKIENETITRASTESREDAAVKEVTTANPFGNVVSLAGKRISSGSRILPTIWIVWIFLIPGLLLSLVQSRCYQYVQSRRKEKYSVIQYIHDSDGRKRRFLNSYVIV